MIAPDPGNLVQHRLQGMRIVDHQRQREVRSHKGQRQRPEGRRDQHELNHRRRSCQPHQPGVAARRPPDRQRALHQRHRKGQHQREMSQLNNHRLHLHCLLRHCRPPARSFNVKAYPSRPCDNAPEAPLFAPPPPPPVPSSVGSKYSSGAGGQTPPFCASTAAPPAALTAKDWSPMS